MSPRLTGCLNDRSPLWQAAHCQVFLSPRFTGCLNNPFFSRYRFTAEGLVERCVTNAAFVSDDLSVAAEMLSVVAAKAALSVVMADVIEMRGPVRLHFRKEIGLINSLHFADRGLNGIAAASVNVGLGGLVICVRSDAIALTASSLVLGFERAIRPLSLL